VCCFKVVAGGRRSGTFRLSRWRSPGVVVAPFGFLTRGGYLLPDVPLLARTREQKRAFKKAEQPGIGCVRSLLAGRCFASEGYLPESPFQE